MALQQMGRLDVAEPARVMARLCFHFSRKVQARHDEVQGEVLFPWGRCEFDVVEGGLAVRLSADDDAASLQRVREVVDAHVALFSRRQPLAVQWGQVTHHR
ncbi:DUF2218 domain-containing protein [Sphaerotilus sp.]|uniref:DUF2218 domain-containing protein n=1 Tax=Sphaerotilus sp. TaxID=2093942 RepID=UPI002ACD4FE6|nr:DUF2218 domain-containing protein [Sphaerotilus sp.]MDZ7855890.1 DUF2218 domain-containing protein [Sphaerotilus sp.]